MTMRQLHSNWIAKLWEETREGHRSDQFQTNKRTKSGIPASTEVEFLSQDHNTARFIYSIRAVNKSCKMVGEQNKLTRWQNSPVV